jgi:hypothetical protein
MGSESSFEVLEERRVSGENNQFAFDRFTLRSTARIPISKTILQDSCDRNEGNHARSDSPTGDSPFRGQILRGTPTPPENDA